MKRNRSKTRHRLVKSLMQLARTLNLSYQRVCRLSHRGVIQKTHQGGYNVTEARKAIREHEAATPGGSPNKFSTKWDMRLRKAKALMAELELGLLKQDLVVKKDVVNEIIQRELEFKDRIFALPHQVAPLLAHKEPREIAEILHERLVEIFKAFVRGETRRH